MAEDINELLASLTFSGDKSKRVVSKTRLDSEAQMYNIPFERMDRQVAIDVGEKCLQQNEIPGANKLNFQYGNWLTIQLSMPNQVRSNLRNDVEFVKSGNKSSEVDTSNKGLVETDGTNVTQRKRKDEIWGRGVGVLLTHR
ncbi:hypothetical protein Goari_014575 [Gossypium aridum]|uniref:Uncharacterized protein n=1 Tax=Gossypium aridum TaxID=34290 RepID=A0A7J8XIK1_GOSAI|nr:hypothetical protein [Gossypium aridum]